MKKFDIFFQSNSYELLRTSKEKREYIRRIIDRPYVKECAVNRKSDRGIIGLTSLLVRMNNALLISVAFKGISLVRKVKA